jgi:hypothetical protein
MIPPMSVCPSIGSSITSERSVTTITLDAIIGLAIAVASVTALVALLTSPFAMLHKEHFLELQCTTNEYNFPNVLIFTRTTVLSSCKNSESFCLE